MKQGRLNSSSKVEAKHGVSVLFKGLVYRVMNGTSVLVLYFQLYFYFF